MLFCNCLVFSRVKVIVAWLSPSSLPAHYFIPEDQKQELHHQVGSLAMHQSSRVLGTPTVSKISGRSSLSMMVELTVQELQYSLRVLRHRTRLCLVPKTQRFNQTDFVVKGLLSQGGKGFTVAFCSQDKSALKGSQLIFITEATGQKLCHSKSQEHFYIIFRVLHSWLDSIFVLNFFCKDTVLEEILAIPNFSGSKLIQAALRGPSSLTDFSCLMCSCKFYYLNLRVFISFSSIAFVNFYTLYFNM